MNELDFLRRFGSLYLLQCNRAQLDLNGDESRQMSDALNDLVHALAKIDAIIDGRQGRAFGGGS